MTDLPGVSIEAGTGLEDATDSVGVWCAEHGQELYSLDYLNSLEPTRRYCRFLQTRLEGRECVVTVMTVPWDEDPLLRILNILLGIRSELSGGEPPVFRFVSAHPVPGVIQTLFRDGPVGEFESRAAAAVGFGVDLRAESGPQLAALAMFLLRESFGLEVDLWSEGGDDQIAKAVERYLLAEEFPDDGVPLNTLLALGFLYGERQRARLEWLSYWVSLGDLGPWPSVIVTNEREIDSDSESVRRVAFSPISMVIGAFQSRQPELLLAAVRDLRERCDREFGPVAADEGSDS